MAVLGACDTICIGDVVVMEVMMMMMMIVLVTVLLVVSACMHADRVPPAVSTSTGKIYFAATVPPNKKEKSAKLQKDSVGPRIVRLRPLPSASRRGENLVNAAPYE